MIFAYPRTTLAAALLVFFLVQNSNAAQGRIQSKLDSGNVHRQDKITQDILTKYLQRRLFPHRAVNTASVDQLLGHNEDSDITESEAVLGSESERVANFKSFDENEDGPQQCTTGNCLDENSSLNRWTMPLLKLGEKRYYLGIFFKANWYRASQYCRYHGMHLASITSQDENDKLERHIKDFGLGNEHFWTSGTDQAEEGSFFWMSTGRPVTFTNWNTGEPNNFRYENGEEEHCLELWNRDGKGLRWNDSPCSFETYFVCEV